MVPDDGPTIRERAIAARPPAWHGENLGDIVSTSWLPHSGAWRDLPKKDRNWLLFTEEQPTAPFYAGFTAQGSPSDQPKEETNTKAHSRVRGGTSCKRSPRPKHSMKNMRRAVHRQQRMSRFPWQAGHSLLTSTAHAPSSSTALSVVANVCSTYRRGTRERALVARFLFCA